MKRNLLKGIVLISAAALSSCSTLTKLSKNNNTLGDDVYYTKAKARVSDYYTPQFVEPPQVTNDDYYYYGNYESRIRRFSYASPFDYDDDFYEDYEPYAYPSYQDGSVEYAYSPDDDTYDPYYDDLGVYSAYDFGYGDYWGYDNFGYGIAYSTFIYNGGTRATHKKDYAHSNNNNGVFVRSNAGTRHYGNSIFGRDFNGNGLTKATVPAFTRSSTGANGTPAFTFKGARPGGSNAVYPGRPGSNSSNSPGNVVVAGTNRPIRPANQNPRPEPVVRQPTMERSSPPQQSSSGNNNGGGGGGSSRGGGGRPVRP